MTLATVITTIGQWDVRMERTYAAMGGLMIVAGDRKSPARFKAPEGVIYLDIAEQRKSPLGRLLPENHYCRKNLAYLEALRHGAEVIFDTDDDNEPLPEREFPAFVGQHDVVDGLGPINVYSYFSRSRIWPRGFPLSALSDSRPRRLTTRATSVGVWQGLADLDPDVDAIFRLAHGEAHRLVFDRRSPVVLPPRAWCPFNSQNTLWKRAAAAYLYLPHTVPFRFTDILRGYVAQRGLWALGLSLGFCEATAVQERNAHDLYADLTDEMEMYVQTPRVLRVLDSLDLAGTPSEDLIVAYSALYEAGVVKRSEIEGAQRWLEDLFSTQ